MKREVLPPLSPPLPPPFSSPSSAPILPSVRHHFLFSRSQVLSLLSTSAFFVGFLFFRDFFIPLFAFEKCRKIIVLVRPLGLGAVGLRVLGLDVGALALAIAVLRLLIAAPRVRVAILAGMSLDRGRIRRLSRLRLRPFLRRWLIVFRVWSHRSTF